MSGERSSERCCRCGQLGDAEERLLEMAKLVIARGLRPSPRSLRERLQAAGAPRVDLAGDAPLPANTRITC